MRILKIEPNKEPYLKEIDSTLESMQHEVGGLIQTINPYADPVVLVCNDEGKLDGLRLNRVLQNAEGEVYDIVAGDMFICGLSEDDFSSLSDDLVVKFYEKFRYPEFFYRSDNGIGYSKCITQSNKENIISAVLKETPESALNCPGYELLNSKLLIAAIDKKDINLHIRENKEMLKILTESLHDNQNISVRIESFADKDLTEKYMILSDIHSFEQMNIDFEKEVDYGISPDNGITVSMNTECITFYPIKGHEIQDIPILEGDYINLERIDASHLIESMKRAVHKIRNKEHKRNKDRIK